uniref:PUM-HD domain-containing protein n=1 Tax=Caenorhabditis tropicalis TaxID=1561998 RepID=A0A1I7UA79_9PELO
MPELYYFDNRAMANRSASSMSSKNSIRNQTILPTWALDANGNIRAKLQLSKDLASGDFGKFAGESNGCQYLQDTVKKSSTPYRSVSSMSSKSSVRNQTILPTWALDSNGNIRPNLQLSKVLDSGELAKFAVDKNGCQFLQDAVKKNLTNYQKHQLFDQIIGRREDFIKYSSNIFGNFLVQQVIEIAMQTYDDGYIMRQEKLKNFLSSQMTDMCLDKSACRVVQFVLEKIELNLACNLVQSLPRDSRLIAICVDQNANHVIQKVVNVIPLSRWEFIVAFVAQPDHLKQICSDKYGCRVVQSIIEKLTNDSISGDLTTAAQSQRERALQRLMNSVTARCQELATNEYANYIIQHIVSNSNLAVYRECIIEKCLMRNLLSLSQEKFASHVVEKAFLNAPLELLAEMMDEIFDGYVPHPNTGKDALDIMMFHQFGNYVVQCMLTICCDAVSGRRETKEGTYDHMKSFHDWLKKLQTRVSKEKHRLTRFSSGKKMIETLEHLRITHPYLGFQPTCHLSLPPIECFSTASEDEDFEREESSLMLQSHLKSMKSIKISSSDSNLHDGDDEADAF